MGRMYGFTLELQESDFRIYSQEDLEIKMRPK